MNQTALFILCFWVVALGAVAFWITQFNQLMALPDDHFPGKHDKLVWVVVLIALNVIGALAFWFFNTAKPKG